MADQTGNQAAEAFSKFWGDMLSSMSAAVPMAAPSFNPVDSAKHMQRAFLDAMAKYCDEFMRSPEYLQMIKQSMDGALSFRKQLDQFLQQAHAGVQTGDIGEVTQALHDLEERMVSRIDALEARLDAQSESGEPSVGTARTRKKAPAAKKSRGQATSGN